MKSFLIALALLSPIAVASGADAQLLDTAGSEAQTENTVADTGYSRYTLSTRYSIDFPNGSYVYYNDNDYLIISSYLPQTGVCCFSDGKLKTDIYTMETPFEEAAAAIATDLSGMAGQFVRQASLTINGRPAVRSWWIGGENNSDSSFTVIRMSATETAYVNSFYGTGDTSLHSTIEAVHNSFQVLE
ncbi:MAG: hypothetical protein AAFY78_05540 [Cyanobacteria bacterium J06648_16]